jgi:hypothetical protein
VSRECFLRARPEPIPSSYQYYRYLVGDGNFVCNHLEQKGGSSAHGIRLGDGAMYLAESQRYQDHLRSAREVTEVNITLLQSCLSVSPSVTNHHPRHQLATSIEPFQTRIKQNRDMILQGLLQLHAEGMVALHRPHVLICKRARGQYISLIVRPPHP